MRLHKILKDSELSSGAFFGKKSTAGFTLVEVLVVMAIISGLFVAGTFVSFDVYRGDLLKSERAMLVSVLQKARSRAMNNIDASPHGVYIDSNFYIIFRGVSSTTAPSTNERIPRNSGVVISGINNVVFTQLSGEPLTVGDIVLTYGIRTATVSVRNGGLIDW